MSHFGSADWNNPSGLVAQLTGLKSLVGTVGTRNGSTEGTDLLSYTTKRAGLYKVVAYLRANVASDGGTHTAAAHVVYNNGSAIAQATIGISGVTPGTLDVKGAAGTHLKQEAVIYAAAGTVIQLLVQDIIGTSNATVGSMNVYFAIQAV